MDRRQKISDIRVKSSLSLSLSPFSSFPSPCLSRRPIVADSSTVKLLLRPRSRLFRESTRNSSLLSWPSIDTGRIVQGNRLFLARKNVIRARRKRERDAFKSIFPKVLSRSVISLILERGERKKHPVRLCIGEKKESPDGGQNWREAGMRTRGMLRHKDATP